MQRNIFFLFLASALILSCSSDSEDDNAQQSDSIEGTWEMSEVRVDDSSGNPDLNLAKEIADMLIAEGCDILTFTFNTDGSLVSQSKLNNFEINVGAGGTGLDVPCPEETDTEVATWSLEGDQLTVTETGGAQETFTIDLSSNTLIIAGEDIDAANYSGTEIVFTRS